jgi:hypothetical protein
MIFCMTAAQFGDASEGLRMTVLPPDIAPIIGPSDSWKGKLKALNKVSISTCYVCLSKREDPYPMTRTVPKGSLRMRGLTSLWEKAMSSGFSSAAHLRRLLLMKMTSFWTQVNSASLASKTGLCKSFWQASSRISLLSSRPQYS